MSLQPLARVLRRWRLKRQLKWNQRYCEMYRNTESIARDQINKLERAQPALVAEINRLK